MTRWWSVLVLASLVAGQDVAPKVWLAVAPFSFHAALEPLVAARKAQGFVTQVKTPPVSVALSEMAGPVNFLLLVGDALSPDEMGKERPHFALDTTPRELYRWRRQQSLQYAADPLYADRDGDLKPDFPVGRIPARTPGELETVVAKILEHEERAPSADDLRLVAWACAPGYGGVVDASATKLLEGMVKKQGPGWSEPWLLSAAVGEPLCGDLPEQPELFLKAMQRPALFAAIAAHASKDYVLVTRSGGRAITLHKRGLTPWTTGPAGPPLVLLACEAGDFAGPERSFAEECLFLRGGPVAAIAATTESHPFPNYLSGQEVTKRLDDGFSTVGELWHAAQLAALTARSFVMEKMLKDVEGSLEPSINVALLRRDQLLMYTFFGDPATRHRAPLKLEIRVEANGSAWKVHERAGYDRLDISFRPKTRTWPPLESAPDSPESARELLRRAQIESQFDPVSTLTSELDWSSDSLSEGALAGPGTLRLLAIGPSKLAVATIEVPAR